MSRPGPSSVLCAPLANRTRQEIHEMILENPQISIQHSIDFMKKLTVAALSTISYLRNIFPAEAFSQRKLGGVKLHILKGLDDIPGTKLMVNWIVGAFEAVKHHYLRKLILVLQRENSEEVIEMYSFNFNYNHEAIACELQSASDSTPKNLELPADIKKATQQLLRTVLVLTSTLDPLPDDCCCSMRLEFNDNVPDEYEMPGCFKVVESLGMKLSPDISSLKLGKIDTKFTTYAVSCKTALKPKGDSEDEDEVQGSQREFAPECTNSFVGSGGRNTQQAGKPAIEPNKGDDLETTKLSETMSSVNLRDVRCICECEDDPGNNSITCASCSTIQHKACYKLLDDQEVDMHICVNCHEPNNPMKTCIVPELINDINRKKEALYRRALVLCTNSYRITFTTILKHLKVSRQEAKQILNRMEIDGCLEPTSGRGHMRTVKSDHLRDNVLGLYFNVSSNLNEEYMESEENGLLNVTEATAGNRKRKNIGQNQGDIYDGRQNKRRKCVTTEDVQSILLNRSFQTNE